MSRIVHTYLEAKLKCDAARQELMEMLEKLDRAEEGYRAAIGELLKEHHELEEASSEILELRKALMNAPCSDAKSEPISPLTRANRAEAIACYVVMTAASLCPTHMHFATMTNHAPVPFAVHWHFKDICGATFDHSQLVSAIEWVKEALLASYGVSWNRTRDKGPYFHYITYDLTIRGPIFLDRVIRHLRTRGTDVNGLPGYAVMKKIIDTAGEDTF